MRDKHYKIRCIRISDETWSFLKDKRKKSGLSWNQYIAKVIGMKSKGKKTTSEELSTASISRNK